MMRVFNLLLCAMFLMGSCVNNDLSSSNRCNLVPDAGPCMAYMPKYYFDKTEQKCKEFIWGGCDGVVPFQTLEECRQCSGTDE